MIRKGLITEINYKSRSGVITDGKGREFYFNHDDIKDNQLLKKYHEVTFVKDSDYCTTNVAILIVPVNNELAS